MPESKKKDAGNSANGVTWLAQKVNVDTDGKRVRIPDEACEIVPWLRDRPADSPPFECRALRGAEGGIQIVTLNGPLGTLYQEKQERIRSDPPKDNESNHDYMKTVRWLAGSWPLSMERHGKAFRFYVPRGINTLKLFKSDLLVCFAAGSVLELWDSAEWDATLRRTAAERDKLE